MAHCKHRVMDKCKKSGSLCTFSERCFEPEGTPIKTNADCIRAMSDEELAKLFCPETPGASPWCEPIGHVRCGKAPCWKCMLKWLRQPAEEEA